jgi:LmbE family N-acetylglucosaminyl deacetylase
MRVDREVPASALAVYAHPDDPEVACGGTLAAWTARGARAAVVVVNRGDKGSIEEGTDPDELAARRADEAIAAGGALGVAEVVLLGYPDGESENDLELRRRLVEIIRRVRPEVVVTPDPTALLFGNGYVNHRDHRVCGAAVLDAVAPAAASPLYFPDTGPAHRVAAVYLSGTLEADTAVDITETLQRKVAALACHRSQLAGGGEWVYDLIEQRSGEAGLAASVPYAETYRVVRLGT